MSDRVIIPLPNVGVLSLDRDVYEAALRQGAELIAAPAASGAVVEPLVDAEQAAAQLGVTARLLEDYARAGIAPCFQIGRFVRFRVSEVAAHFRRDGAVVPASTDSESFGRKNRPSRQ